jgi:uncharacterized phage-associated protein
MTTISDVAEYILRARGPMSTMKLQKLCYYSQAWSLVWDDRPLFDAQFEAWANGPVAPALYAKHRGSFSVDRIDGGNPEALSQTERDTVDAVLRDYGNLSGRALSFLTHAEAPWVDARGSLPPTARSNQLITPDAMAAYYAALDADENVPEITQLDWSAWEPAEA